MMSDEEVRIHMREHFLRTLNQFNGEYSPSKSIAKVNNHNDRLTAGERAVFIMHENMTLTGQFGCSNADLNHFYVTNLKTPIGVSKDSLLRCSDIILVEFKPSPNLSKIFLTQ